eukprot:768185-Hanusia_phi.AAC.2
MIAPYGGLFMLRSADAMADPGIKKSNRGTGRPGTDRRSSVCGPGPGTAARRTVRQPHSDAGPRGTVSHRYEGGSNLR